ncbi:MAG: adenylate/guanylate cyclase domain-containing protein [Actinomycetota bacterium]
MRFVILVKSTKGSEAGVMPVEEDLAKVLAYNQELVRKGIMLDGVGLAPTSEGFRIRFSADGRTKTVIEGPFDDENLVAGYWLIEVASRDEAMQWAMRTPKPAAGGEYGEIEVRRVFELDDFEESPAIEGFRELEEMESIARDVERTRPDLSGAVAPNGTVTILFTDIEGSTQLTEDLGDREWMELLRKHNEIVRSQLALHSGFEVKSQGDGFMLAFSSARDALRCARAIQLAVAESDSNGHRLRVRIGLHTGEPVREADDFYGKAVIQAARIAAEARGSEVLVSWLVRDLTESTGEFSFEAPREVELKGLTGMHTVSAVRWRD